MAARRKGLIAAVMLMFALLASACTMAGVNIDTGGVPPVGIGLNPTGPGYEVSLDPSIVDAANRLGLHLFQHLQAQDGPGAGVFISPTSINIALAMTYNGSGGETRSAMGKAMGIDHLTLQELNDGYYALIRELTSAVGDSGDLRLIIANGIWYRLDVNLYEEFLENNRRFYGAEVRGLDFDDPSSVNAINNWVNVHTAGRITDLMQEIRPDSELLLVNAIYFWGTWTNPFDPALSYEDQFLLPGGQFVDIQMMRQDGTFGYMRGNSFQVVRLPYGDDERVAMYVFLPDEDSDLIAFYRQLTYENLTAWMAGVTPQPGIVSLPRFQLRYKASLNDALSHLGMAIAFDAQRADFSRMRPVSPGHNLYIGDVLQATFLAVNEAGTEAAAATSVEVRTTSLLVDKFSFIADRPFFVVIRDDLTGAVLFMGSVVQPEAVA